MFNVTVSPEIFDYCAWVLSNHDFGRRLAGNGNPQEQLTGLVGQVTILDLFEMPRPDGAGGPDGGVDFMYRGLSVDVKTVGRNWLPLPHYSNNLTAFQKDSRSDVLLCCSYHRRAAILTVCGWIEKAEFLRQAAFFPAGAICTRDDGSSFRLKSDQHQLENRQLRDVCNLPELKAALARVSESRQVTCSQLAVPGSCRASAAHDRERHTGAVGECSGSFASSVLG